MDSHGAGLAVATVVAGSDGLAIDLSRYPVRL